MENVRVVFIKDLIFMTGNCYEGDEYILTKEDADYFSNYIKILNETNEKAISFI
jgi:hypothetical protein